MFGVRQHVVPVLFATALMALVGACGNSDTSPDAGSAARLDKEAEFLKCLKENGANISAFAGGAASELTDEQVNAEEKAFKACEKYAPVSKISAAEEQKMQDEMLAYTKCMREYGVDMPDPKFDGNGGSTVVGEAQQIDPNDPTYAAAAKACGDKLGIPAPDGGVPVPAPDGDAGQSDDRGGAGSAVTP
ncbi:MAG: hypothetical protein ACRCYU_10905 [Nocardioides sp.]